MKKSQGNIIYHFLPIKQRMSEKKMSVILNSKQNRNLKPRLKLLISKKVKVLQNNQKKVLSVGTIHKNNGKIKL